MPITINGSGTVTGISAGGLPDAIITAPELSGAQTGSAPIYGCRAWVNFDGTRNEADTGASTNGANVKIRASGNVTSVLKNATGDYTITFTTAMPDANYAYTHGAAQTATGTGMTTGYSNTVFFTASTFRFLVAGASSNLAIDCTASTVAIFR
jgi:hypothetical protein